ncbi:MAG: hypothetical protein ACXV4A_16300 [Actinomycetes bacterium]
MTAAGIFAELRGLMLPAGDYVVFGSGPLVVRGIVPLTGDLDVLVRGRAWEAARRLGPTVHLPEFGVDVVRLLEGRIEIGTSWGIGQFDGDELIDGAELLDGLPFARLRHVRSYKETAGREKDLAHLRMLDAWESGRQLGPHAQL